MDEEGSHRICEQVNFIMRHSTCLTEKLTCSPSVEISPGHKRASSLSLRLSSLNRNCTYREVGRREETEGR